MVGMSLIKIVFDIWLSFVNTALHSVGALYLLEQQWFKGISVNEGQMTCNTGHQ